MANFVRCSVEKKCNFPVNIDLVISIKKDTIHRNNKINYIIEFEGSAIIWEYGEDQESLRNADFERIVGGENLNIPKNEHDFKDRRVKLGLSMRKVAELTGISTATISRAERGNEITFSKARRLDKFYLHNGV